MQGAIEQASWETGEKKKTLSSPHEIYSIDAQLFIP